MRQYSIDQVAISWQDLPFKDGVAAGSVFTDTPAVPAFTQTVNAMGHATSTHDPNRSGTIAILVDERSTLYRKLMLLIKADRDPNQRNKVGPMKVSDASSGDVTDYKNVRCTGRAGRVYGTTSQSFSFNFTYESYNDQLNEANLTSVIGA